jgi:hypothetical protein
MAQRPQVSRRNRILNMTGSTGGQWCCPPLWTRAKRDMREG